MTLGIFGGGRIFIHIAKSTITTKKTAVLAVFSVAPSIF
jgi:hypothetical protein